MKYSIITFSYR